MNLSETIISLIGIIIGAFLTYVYGIRTLRRESIELVERSKYDAILLAHRHAYQLLRFTTDTENEDAILLWEQPRGSQEKTYFIRPDRAHRFMDELTTTIYRQGHGLFLSADVMTLLSKYRSNLYGFLLATKEDTSARVKVQKAELAKELIRIHHELSPLLRKVIQLKKRHFDFER